MKKGFSLTELLTTIVIMAVLAGIAVPGFSKAKDKAAAAQAIAYLRTIAVGEKMYYARNAVYIACADKTAIKNNLGADVTEENYKFKVTVGSPATSFTAMARKGATPSACTDTESLCIYQDGTWGGTSTYKPAS